MKKSIAVFTCFVFLFLFTACSAKGVTNLDWKNSGEKAGPSDGPGYTVYSKTGYNKASEIVHLSKIQSNLSRKDNNKGINAYVFLGIDVYRNGTQWQNCVDAGIVRSGNDGKWHACMNRYMADPDESTWWESTVSLDASHDYKLELDSSKKDEEITLSVIDVTDGNKTVETKTVGFYFTKADGSNTSFYQCVSMAFPPDIRYDTKGNADSSDYEEVLLYNTDQNIYFKNVKVTDLTLYNAAGSYSWTEERTKDRFMWPNQETKIKYPCVSVGSVKKDFEEVVSLNLNK